MNFIEFSFLEMSQQSQFTETESRSAIVSPDSNAEKVMSALMSDSSSVYTKQEKPPPQLPLMTQAQQLQQQLQQENSSCSAAVDEEIRRLRAQLPPIDYSVLDDEETEDTLPCTCTFKEVTVMIDPVTGLEIDQDDFAKLPNENLVDMKEEKDEKIQIHIIKSEIEDEDETYEANHIMDDDSDEDREDDFSIVNTDDYISSIQGHTVSRKFFYCCF